MPWIRDPFHELPDECVPTMYSTDNHAAILSWEKCLHAYWPMPRSAFSGLAKHHFQCSTFREEQRKHKAARARKRARVHACIHLHNPLSGNWPCVLFFSFRTPFPWEVGGERVWRGPWWWWISNHDHPHGIWDGALIGASCLKQSGNSGNKINQQVNSNLKRYPFTKDLVDLHITMHQHLKICYEFDSFLIDAHAWCTPGGRSEHPVVFAAPALRGWIILVSIMDREYGWRFHSSTISRIDFPLCLAFLVRPGRMERDHRCQIRRRGVSCTTPQDGGRRVVCISQPWWLLLLSTPPYSLSP